MAAMKNIILLLNYDHTSAFDPPKKILNPVQWTKIWFGQGVAVHEDDCMKGNKVHMLWILLAPRKIWS